MLKYLMLILTICALIGFVMGLMRFFRTRKALYTRMIVFGLGCAMMGRLFETLLLFVQGEISSGFHIGVLGVLGSFLFFFTANYGQMDSLVDDGSRHFLKYRLIALAAPAVMIVLFGFVFKFMGPGVPVIIRAIETLVICLATYFNLKHLIIEDVDYGIIRSIRGYNLLALIYAVLCMVEMLFTVIPVPGVLLVILYMLLSAIMIVFVPVLAGGVKKWTT